MTPLGRREAFAGVAAVAASLWGRRALGERASLGAGQVRLLEAVCDLMIPATGTTGALGAGVPGWMALALQHGLDRTVPTAGMSRAPQSGPALLDALGDALDREAGGRFVDLPPGRQGAVLAAHDAAALAPGAPPAPWQTIKSLILTGYFTSEVGGSEALRYVLIPGRFEPDIPLTPDMRAFSSDWTAVDFG